MTYDELLISLSESMPSPNLPPLIAALWWDAKGDWNRAHEIAQDIGSKEGARVHAYLHRKEGDTQNAGYWYRQAGEPHSQLSSDEEWKQIIRDTLG
jgi:hypothetical protein